MKVYSLREAESWFLNNSSGAVICVKGDKKMECDSYPKAAAFYESEEKQ